MPLGRTFGIIMVQMATFLEVVGSNETVLMKFYHYP
jgi:hypothetical protein